MTKVLVGAAQWQVEQWQGSFYPDDLPTDWQLPYYANEFSTVLLEYQQAKVSAPQLLEMLDDCQEQFQPVLSLIDHEVTIEQVDGFFRRLLEVDEEHGIGRLAGVKLTMGEGALDQSRLQAWRECIPQALPMALDVDSHYLDENRKWLIGQQMSPVWQAGQLTTEDQPYWLASFSLDVDARQLATQVRDFLAVVADDGTTCLIATGNYEDIANLNEFSTIVRLING